MNQGLFISFEGGDGSGKTTVCRYVSERLAQAGYDTLYTREPGGSGIAEQIRAVILDVANTGMDVRTEALLYAASRRQHLTDVVLPALQAGKIVVSDRFVDSSLAYQGWGRGIGIDEVLSINQFAIEDHMPDLTVYLDVPPEVGLARIQKGRSSLDRLDQESLKFHQQVYEGYRRVIARYPQRIRVIDADRAVEAVQRDAAGLVLDWVKEHV
jgi:dTMP kinase